MTRLYESRPVWVWVCDRCGEVGREIAHEQNQLPTMTEMRARGWYIPALPGDLCPKCNGEVGKAAAQDEQPKEQK